MSASLRQRLRQRADYTHRHNASAGRHGWLRLTPAYSLKIVNELLASADPAKPATVLDPFSGTATTALAAAYRGHRAVTVEINPFLHWFGQAKTAAYSQQTLDSAASLGVQIVNLSRTVGAEAITPPPMQGIERWWNPDALNLLRRLKAAIDEVCPSPGQHRDLLLIAFCRLLIDLSNVRFNHQSLSVDAERSDQLRMDLHASPEDQFCGQLETVLQSAADNPEGAVQVVQGDARDLRQVNHGADIAGVDLLITSPPYVNRMSYIRELRPHMYWLGYLSSGREAGELDWQAIGGTWGVATSRLTDWQSPLDTFQSTTLREAVERIASDRNRNGALLANYVLKYFADIWSHLSSVPCTLNPGAHVHYIVGNSSFYGVLVPVERVYSEMLTELGFERVECEPIRKRNSNRKLFEFDVSARWNGLAREANNA